MLHALRQELRMESYENAELIHDPEIKVYEAEPE